MEGSATLKFGKPAIFILLIVLVVFFIIKFSTTTVIQTTKEIDITSNWTIPSTWVGVNSTTDFLLYRGVPQGHYNYYQALEGTAMPLNPTYGHTNPTLHRDGNTNSKFTSWTINLMVAYHFATNFDGVEPTNGFILVTTYSNLIKQKAKVYSTETSTFEGDIYGENEYLVTDIIDGCIVIPVSHISKIDVKLIKNILLNLK